MKVKQLKKIISVVDDEVEIYISIYRNGKLDSSSCLNSVEILEDDSGVKLISNFKNDNSKIG